MWTMRQVCGPGVTMAISVGARCVGSSSTMVTRHLPPACPHFLVEQFWPHIISDIIYYGDQDKSPSHLPASPHCKQRRKIV